MSSNLLNPFEYIEYESRRCVQDRQEALLEQRVGDTFQRIPGMNAMTFVERRGEGRGKASRTEESNLEGAFFHFFLESISLHFSSRFHFTWTRWTLKKQARAAASVIVRKIPAL